MKADTNKCEARVKVSGGIQAAMRMGRQTPKFEPCQNKTTTVVVQGSDEMGLCDGCCVAFKERNPEGFRYVKVEDFTAAVY